MNETAKKLYDWHHKIPVLRRISDVATLYEKCLQLSAQMGEDVKHPVWTQINKLPTRL